MSCGTFLALGSVKGRARMALHLVPLLLMLAVSQTRTEQCASYVGPRMELLVRGHQNASGHRIVTVDTRRFTSTNQWEFTVNVHQERRSCGGNEIEQLVSVTSVYPPRHASSIEPSAASTTTTTPKSCPHSGYRLFPGFNCYKPFPGEAKNWSDAREVCRRDGGDLMVAETQRERKEVYIPLYDSESEMFYPLMGVYIPEGGENWMSVKGEPALSTWWWPDCPEDHADYRCAWTGSTGRLRNTYCSVESTFICEIPL